MVLILTRKDLEAVMTMKETKVVENAFKELTLSTARMPTRVGLTVFDRTGWMGVMPAYLSEIGSLAAKIVAGKKRGRISDDEITLFKSVGLGVQDAAAAYLAYKKASEAGVGFEVELFGKS